jgi:ribosome recycling factor
MINDILKNAESHMQKAIEGYKQELNKLRTGRAHSSLVEGVKVDYYGTETQLKHIANIVASDARTITVTPWEKTMLKAIEKAIASADLGLNPLTDNNVIRVPIPQLTEERRKDLVKVVKSAAEHARIVIRNVRRDANAELKKLIQDKKIAEDDERRSQDNVQKLTDKYITEVDKITAQKEQDLLEV